MDRHVKRTPLKKGVGLKLGIEGLLAPTSENYRRSLETLAPGEGGLIISFFLNSTEYAFEITDAFEVIKPGPLTRVPLTPDFIMGIISARGEMVPVIDTKKRLGLDETSVAANSRILIAGDEERKAGFLVDRVGSVKGFASHSLSPQRSGEFVKGILTIEGITIPILDLSRLLNIMTP